MSPDLPLLSGLVLAGGSSHRMGRDKALLVVGGETMLARAIRLAGALTDDVVVACGDRPLPLPSVVRQVPDAATGGGPLGGLIAGLEAAAHDLVAVIAVDMPFADPAVLRRLAALWTGQPAVVPEVHGRLQPLHAIWHTSAAGPLRARAGSGDRSLTGAATGLGALVTEAWRDVDPTGRFAQNVNDPADYEELMNTGNGSGLRADDRRSSR